MKKVEYKTIAQWRGKWFFTFTNHEFSSISKLTLNKVSFFPFFFILFDNNTNKSNFILLILVLLRRYSITPPSRNQLYFYLGIRPRTSYNSMGDHYYLSFNRANHLYFYFRFKYCHKMIVDAEIEGRIPRIHVHI